MADFGCSAFALLNYFYDFITRQDNVNRRDAGSSVLLKCLHNFSCEADQEVALKLAIRMIVNIYYNSNKNVKMIPLKKMPLLASKKGKVLNSFCALRMLIVKQSEDANAVFLNF